MMYMPLTLPALDGVHDLDHGQAGLVVELRSGHAPCLFETLARGRAATRW
jgi:hypothetical protein